MNLASSKKMFYAFLIAVAGVLGIEFTNLEWWTWFIVAVGQALAVYWAKNKSGTLLTKNSNREISDPT